MRHSPSTFESSPETTAVQAGALFVDLDETFLQGTVTHMTPEELERSLLNGGVLAKIKQARSLGIPVVMVTRNSHELIERFFQAHPEARSLFNDEIACEVGSKGSAIKAWKQAHGIAEDAPVAFTDDTSGELSDVKRVVEEAQVFTPQQIAEENLGALRVTRLRARRVFAGAGKSNQIELAA